MDLQERLSDRIAGPAPTLSPRLGSSSRRLDARLFSQRSGRLLKLHLLIEHQELEGVSPGVTAEAVKKLLLLVHREGGCLLGVEGAEPHVSPTGLAEGYVLSHE